MNKVSFPPPNDIPKNHPYDLCMHFNKDNKLMGYFTYLAYKDYKLEWIKNQKEQNKKEPTPKELEKFKNGLMEKDYENFIARAEISINQLFTALVQDEVTKQLPNAISNSNFSNIKEIMKVRAASENTSEKNLGNAIHEIHKATTHKCKSFGLAIVASALGTFSLAIIFVLFEIIFKTGLFQKLFSFIVPM